MIAGGIPLYEEEARNLLSMEDKKSVIIVPYEEISASPRGVISVRDFLQGGNGHVVARGAFGNSIGLLNSYMASYIQLMKTSPFTPLEIGVWFSKDEGKNTMRPLEIGDSGIGIYNRNLVNKEYRTIGIRH